MKYMGSKSRIKKFIIPIINEKAKEYTTFIDAFVGGANVIDSVECKNKIGYDYNVYLIALLNHVKNGNELPKDVSRELYNDVRENKDNKKYDDWFVGAVGFLASYNGRFFDGGYAKPSSNRNYYDESKRNLEKQKDLFDGIIFERKDFFELDVVNTLIYCDPPYKDTTQYGINKNFDSEKFWDKVRLLSKNNYVIISEETAPDDFICIWEKEVLRSIKAKDKSMSTEKLFIHESLYYETKR